MSVTTLAHYPHRRAARFHRCMDCWGLIAVGDLYSDERNAYDGHAYTWREHALCRALFEVCFNGDDDDAYDPVDSDLPDWWREFAATFAPGAADHARPSRSVVALS